jgi:hypothetical protein
MGIFKVIYGISAQGELFVEQFSLYRYGIITGLLYCTD